MKKQFIFLMSLFALVFISCGETKTTQDGDNTKEETVTPADNKAGIEDEQGNIDLEKLEESVEDLPAE